MGRIRDRLLPLLILATGLAHHLPVGAVDCGEIQPEVSFALLRLDFSSLDVRHVYQFVQCHRKSLVPDELAEVADVFIDFDAPADVGQTEIFSRLTGERVFLASSIWSGTGRLHWPTDSEEVFGFEHGLSAVDPELFSWWLPYEENDAGARAAWESVRDIDLVVGIASQGRSALLSIGTLSIFRDTSSGSFSCTVGRSLQRISASRVSTGRERWCREASS